MALLQLTQVSSRSLYRLSPLLPEPIVLERPLRTSRREMLTQRGMTSENVKERCHLIRVGSRVGESASANADSTPPLTTRLLLSPTRRRTRMPTSCGVRRSSRTQSSCLRAGRYVKLPGSCEPVSQNVFVVFFRFSSYRFPHTRRCPAKRLISTHATELFSASSPIIVPHRLTPTFTIPRAPQIANAHAQTGLQRSKLQAHFLPEPGGGVDAVGAPGNGILQGGGVHAPRR